MDSIVSRLAAVNIFAWVIYSAVSSFIPIYLSESGYSEAQIGLIFAVGALVMLARPFFSLLADWWGRRRLTQISILSGSLSYIAYTVNAYAGKFLEYVYSATWVLRSAIVDACPKRELNSVLANLNGTEVLAYGCGMVLGGIVIGYLGFSQTFYIAAVLNFLLIFFIPRFRERTAHEVMRVDWNFSKPLLIVSLLSLAWGVGHGITTVIVPLIYSDFFQLDIVRIGAFVSIVEVVHALPLMVLKKRLDSHDARMLAIFSSLIIIPVSALLFMTRIFPTFYLLTLLVSAVYAFFPTALDRLVVDASRKKFLAFDMSITTTTYSLGLGIGALLVGPVVGTFGLFGAYLVEVVQGLLIIGLLFI